MIETFLHACYSWIHHLSTEDLPECAVFAAMLYVAFCKKYAGKRWLRPGIGGVLAGGFLAVLWTTILNRESGAYESSWIPLHSYWMIFSGGHPELERSGLMNVLLFYPGGLLRAGLLSKRLRDRHGMLFTVVCFGLFSLSIELCQHFLYLGTAEIDDVLHNTLGAVTGFASSTWTWVIPTDKKSNTSICTEQRSDRWRRFCVVKKATTRYAGGLGKVILLHRKRKPPMIEW